MRLDTNSMEIKSADVLGENNSTLLNQVIVFGSDKFGEGNAELGEILIKGYIYSLMECPPYPKAMLFINSGVKLTALDSPVIEDLRELESKGVEILSCGTCLDFYNIKDKLCVGGVTNMYAIVEMMNSAGNTIKI